MSLDSFLKNPVVNISLRICRWIPVAFIFAVIVWSYYAYVYELCFRAVESIAERIVYLILYHCVLLLFLWSYWKTTYAELGTIPKKFAIPTEMFRQLLDAPKDQQRIILETVAKNQHLPLATRTFDGSIRMCEKCRMIKPDRAHHCSVCGLCVLKMDHHCPWVNTCVSYTNYKFFILFLGYALLYCVYVAATDLQYFIQFWANDVRNGSATTAGKFNIMFLFFVAGMFAISVSVLFFYHLWLVSKNRTTLESFRAPVFTSGPDKNGFNLGRRGNFQEVFGPSNLNAALPLFTAMGDGCSYPIVGHNYLNDSRNSSAVGDLLNSTVDLEDEEE